MDGFGFLLGFEIVCIIIALYIVVKRFRKAIKLREYGYSLWDVVGISFLWFAYQIEKEIESVKKDRILLRDD